MKSLIGPVALASVLALAGCASATHYPDVARLDKDAAPYRQAHAACWQNGYGEPVPQPGADATRTHAYGKCIKDRGWDDRWATL